MRRALSILALLFAMVLIPWLAVALEWGGIEPGVTSLEQVRDRYGAPSKESRAKVEGYDTIQWIYEGQRAPTGIIRMTVDFGLLTPAGYKPNVVRVFVLEPKPNIFGRNTVMQGWGVPDGFHRNADGTMTVVWKDGLLATFDTDDQNAVTMIFSLPQNVPIGTNPPAPPQAAPKSGPPDPKR